MNQENFTSFEKSRPKTLTTEQLLNRLQDGLLNLNPTYQRDFVWPKEYRNRFILTLIGAGRVPNPITLFEDSGIGFICADGKQRITSTNDFRNGKFKVKLPNGTEISYTDMASSTEMVLRGYYKKFVEANWAVEQYPPASIEEQRDLFRILNYAESLSTNEKIYCPNFHTKALMDQLWKVVASEIPALAKAKLARGNNLRFLHSILFKVFGMRLSEAIDVKTADRGIECKDITKSSSEIHEMAIRANHLDGNPFDETLLKKMGIDKSVDCFISVIKSLGMIYTRTPMSKRWEKSCIRDALMFFTYMNFTNRLTTSQLDEHAAIFEQVLLDYQEELTDEENLSGALGRHDGHAISERMGLLHDHVIDACQKNGIDTDKKRRGLSTNDVTKAMSKGNRECPVCNKILTDENCQVDHLDPKSKSSIHIPVVICSDCNLRKSNWSEPEYKKYLDYIAVQKQITELAV